MDKRLAKIIETIDSLDENNQIKECYKELLILEFKSIGESKVRHDEIYKKIINSFMEDYDVY